MRRPSRIFKRGVPGHLGAYGNAYPTVDLERDLRALSAFPDVKKRSTISDMLDSTASMNDRIMGGVLDNYAYALSAMAVTAWGTQVGLTATQILYAQRFHGRQDREIPPPRE